MKIVKIILIVVGLLSTSTGLFAQTNSAKPTEIIEPSLVALGTLGASNLYYSYLTIGSAADSFVSGSYEPKLAIAIANEVIFLNTGAVKNLSAMLSTKKYSPDDEAALTFLIQTYDLLSNQAKALITFITDKKDEGTVYQDFRTKAWENIRKIFGKNS